MRKSLFTLALLASTAPAVPALAQPSASPFTSAQRFDAMGRVTGTIAPDPDGAGPLGHQAVRNSYDQAGRLTKVETGILSDWQSESIAPAQWSGFAVYQVLDTAYDAMGRKTRDTVSGRSDPQQSFVTASLTQYSYDAVGRLECTAVRMNLGAAPPASACVLGTEGAHGPDRITRSHYDAAGQLIQARVAVGTAAEAAEATLAYNLNGQRTSVTDGNGNRAEMRFDGHGRQVRWVFPSPTTPGAVNEADYEAYGYDPNGNRTSLRNRAGQVTGLQYDALNRLVLRDRPGAEPDVSYGYDLRGLQTHARFGSASGPGIANAYDGFGQIASSVTDMDGTARTVASHYDLAGRRTAITGDAGYHAGFSYDGTSRLTAYAEGGTNIVVRLGYNGVGLRSSLSFGAVPSSSTGYGYDGAARLASLGHDLAGTGADQARTFGYNAASQIVTRTGSNDAYAANAPAGVAAYSVNGLNQYVAVGGVGHGYDANGNLTFDGSTTYVYDSENRLVSASGARNATLSYDPLGRLWQVSGANGTTRFLYDGDRLIQEYGGSGNVLRTYVHGTGTDEPLVWYDYVGGFSRRFLHADERGSIVAVADENGNALAINRYDEYGVPAAGNLGRFSYTGQTWIPELGLYYYKARMYHPEHGRFMQIDPVGYEDQWNLYAYVRNDPANLDDPTGMDTSDSCGSRIVGNNRCSGGSYIDFEDFMGRLIQVETRGPRAFGGGGGTAPNSPHFIPPTNPPTAPPLQGPPQPAPHGGGYVAPGPNGTTIRIQPPSPATAAQGYPDGYWTQETRTANGPQRLNPGTGSQPRGPLTRPQFRSQTHVPLPRNYELPVPTTIGAAFRRGGIIGVIIWGLTPDPAW